MFIVTPAWINANKTPAGGFKAAQFRLLGIKYPPVSGWMGNCDGLHISEAARREFESYHQGNKATAKSKRAMESGRNIGKDGGLFASVQYPVATRCNCKALPWEDCQHTIEKDHVDDEGSEIEMSNQLGEEEANFSWLYE